MISNKEYYKLLETLDIDKVYCKKCLEEGIVTELTLDKENNVYNISCEHSGKYFSHLKYCPECKIHTYHRGISEFTQCYSCVMSKNALTAIENGVHSCQNPETSLSNPILHQKTIDSQIANGTFCMFNPEVHAKATKTKLIRYSRGEKTKCCKCKRTNLVLNSFGLCGECQSKVAKEVRKPKFDDSDFIGNVRI